MTEMTPLEVLQEGYRKVLKKYWKRALEKRGWRVLPRLVGGTVLFTLGYIFLVLWDGIQGWMALFEEYFKKKKEGS